MTKELERAGLPTASYTAIPVLHQALGTPRILLGKAVGHVVGDPELSPERERAFRRALIEKGLAAIRTPVDSPTLFGLD
jgi:glycine reductase complex component B subunit gamma